MPTDPSDPADDNKTRLRPVPAVRSDPGADDSKTRVRGPVGPRAATAVPAPPTTSSRTGTGQWERPHDWTGVWTEPVAGAILKGRYYLDRKVGEGGMGIVFRARDLEGERLGSEEVLAIKLLTGQFREHRDALKALHEEVRKSRSLAHPNIVNVYTFDRDGQNVFMAMEFLEGKSVSALIQEEYARGMPFGAAWSIIDGMGKALAYAHDRGIVHSDFKPTNVFVTAGGKAKVIDFGIARAVRGKQAGHFDTTDLGAITPAYASCEMLEGQSPDARDDVFALGCVIYELLSGSHPFDRKAATVARDARAAMRPIQGLSARQNRAIAMALAFGREERTASVEEFLHELQVGARKSSRAPLVAALVFGVASLAGGAAWWMSARGPYGGAEDAAFVESLLKPTAPLSEEYDASMVQTLFELGNGYLAEAKTAYDPAKLSEGVSTAYGSYQSVLELDPANRPAAEGILEVLKLHRSEANRLFEEKQYRRALEVTDYALRIAPDSAGLNDLRTKIIEKLGVDAAP